MGALWIVNGPSFLRRKTKTDQTVRMRGRCMYIPTSGTLQVLARLCRELIQGFRNF